MSEIVSYKFLESTLLSSWAFSFIVIPFIGAFMDDVKEQGQEENVVILMFSEFGRRIRDNGAGTDHGSGGVAFVREKEGRG